MIRLTVPYPPRLLNPNARPHWAAKRRAAREYRAAAHVEACRTLRAGQRPGWARAEAQATVYAPDRRRRDRDNLAAALKPVWDGLVDAGILTDDAGLVHLPLALEVDPKRPRVEIVLRPRADPGAEDGRDAA